MKLNLEDYKKTFDKQSEDLTGINNDCTEGLKLLNKRLRDDTTQLKNELYVSQVYKSLL
jgi:hypothetical protein